MNALKEKSKFACRGKLGRKCLLRLLNDRLKGLPISDEAIAYQERAVKE